MWPDDDHLRSLGNGARYELFELSPVVADANGRFEIALPANLPRRYVGQGGEILLQITGSDGTHAIQTNLSVVKVSPGGGRVLAGARTAGSFRVVRMGDVGTKPSRTLKTPNVTLDVGARTARRERDRARAAAKRPGDVRGTPAVVPAEVFGMATPSGRRLTGRVAASQASRSTYDYWDCWHETGSRHGPYMERFATFYGKSYTKGRVRHDAGTTHTLGVGAKAPGGTWGQYGTDSVKASGFGYDTNYTIVDAHVHNRIWQRYHYAKCRSQATGKVETTTYSKPAGFSDGPDYTYAGHVDYATCRTGFPTHEYHRITHANYTYAAGLDLPFVNLSAKSGWSSTTEMYWQFTKVGKLCGNNGQQWSYAKRVSAR